MRTGRIVTGWRVVAQAIYRRLTTERGTLRGGDEEAAYGVDLAGYVGAVALPAAIAQLPGIVRAECMKDDRVSNVEASAATATASNGLVSITLDIAVTLVDEGESFDLTLSVSTGGVKLLFAEAS
jgi:hypothetical protein